MIKTEIQRSFFFHSHLEIKFPHLKWQWRDLLRCPNGSLLSLGDAIPFLFNISVCLRKKREQRISHKQKSRVCLISIKYHVWNLILFIYLLFFRLIGTQWWKNAWKPCFLLIVFFWGCVCVRSCTFFTLYPVKKIFCCSVSFHQGNTLFQLGHSLNQLESPEKT